MDPDQLLQTRALVANRLTPHLNTLQRWEAFKKRRPMLARFWGPLRPYVKPVRVPAFQVYVAPALCAGRRSDERLRWRAGACAIAS
jgi:hypothetical protein